MPSAFGITGLRPFHFFSECLLHFIMIILSSAHSNGRRNLVFSGLVRLLDSPKWPSCLKRLPTPVVKCPIAMMVTLLDRYVKFLPPAFNYWPVLCVCSPNVSPKIHQQNVDGCQNILIVLQLWHKHVSSLSRKRNILDVAKITNWSPLNVEPCFKRNLNCCQIQTFRIDFGFLQCSQTHVRTFFVARLHGPLLISQFPQLIISCTIIVHVHVAAEQMRPAV